MSVTYNHGGRYLFCLIFLPLNMQIPFILQISLATKMLPLIDACLFGHPVYNYFDCQDFLSFASDFISTCESLRNICEKLIKV